MTGGGESRFLGPIKSIDPRNDRREGRDTETMRAQHAAPLQQSKNDRREGRRIDGPGSAR